MSMLTFARNFHNPKSMENEKMRKEVDICTTPFEDCFANATARMDHNAATIML